MVLLTAQNTSLLKIVDVLDRKTFLFYIYDD